MSDHRYTLEEIAPKLNQLQEDPNARVHYELMSDGLVWSDEVPPWEQLAAGECHCLRAIWKFRSSLIMGTPEEKFRLAWNRAQELFPNWPGFLPQRQLATWKKTYSEQRAKLIAEWDALDEKYECRRAETTGSTPAAL